jgi:hypothetical protein
MVRNGKNPISVLDRRSSTLAWLPPAGAVEDALDIAAESLGALMVAERSLIFDVLGHNQRYTQTRGFDIVMDQHIYPGE